MTGFGFAFTTTFTGAETPEQLFASFAVTEKTPDAVTVILCEVSPLLQAYELVEAVERITESPSQKTVFPEAVIATIGLGFTVTFRGTELPRQPFRSVTETE